jgi:hypothetical protein
MKTRAYRRLSVVEVRKVGSDDAVGLGGEEFAGGLRSAGAVRGSRAALAGGEDEAVEVGGGPAVAAGGADCPSLFVGGGFDEDGLAVADAGGEDFPQAVADAAVGVADVDAGVDFDHPAGEVAAESFGGCDQDDDGHGV